MLRMLRCLATSANLTGRAILVRWSRLSLGLYPLVEVHTTSCSLYFLNKCDRCVLLYFRMILVGYSAIPSLGGLLDPRWRNWGFYRIWRSPVTGVLCQEVQTNYLSGSKNVWLLAGHWPSSDMVIEKKRKNHWNNNWTIKNSLVDCLWNGTYTTHLIGDYVGTPISWNNLNSWMIQLDASSATSPGPFCFHACHSLHFYLSSSSPCFPSPCGNQWTHDPKGRQRHWERDQGSIAARSNCVGWAPQPGWSRTFPKVQIWQLPSGVNAAEITYKWRF